MKVTIDWLKKYVDFSFSADDLAHHLTMLGLEVESVKQVNYGFVNVIIGEIQNIKKHETINHLKICDVNIGKDNLPLVCGAPNVRTGLKVPVAVVGAKLPNIGTVQTAVIHGYESPGMICSETELGLSHQSEIIMELSNHSVVGQDLAEYLGEGETVIEIDLTPNRSDCLGVIGIAREIAALNNTQVVKPEISLVESDSLKIDKRVEVSIKAPDICPRYTARYIEGVEIKPSPRWLIQKLEAVGLRTINNVVDITNYVMLETGQPLHAFDYDLLEDQKIVVRRAEQDEKFVTLDGEEHRLTKENLLICDGRKPVALAGVMGGLNSEVTRETRNILLESAFFDPINIRKTAKGLSISTDSSQRFERGVDSNGLIYALNRATQLISELAGGTVAKGQVDCYPAPKKEIVVKLRQNRVNDLLGTKLNLKEILDILHRLEFKTKTENNTDVLVSVPSFRVDIEREVDLIEEISRIYGFDKVQETAYSKVTLQADVNQKENFIQLLRDFVVRLGYYEVVSLSLLNVKLTERFSSKIPIRLRNPISEDLGTLRTSLIPGIMQTIRWNMNRKMKNQKFFEIGNIFYYINEKQNSHNEVKRIVLALTGNVRQDSWLEKSRKTTFYDLKGDLDFLLKELGTSNIKYKESNKPYLKSEKNADIFIDETRAGTMGAISKNVLASFDIDDEVYVVDLDFEKLYHHYRREKKAQPISKYPEIKRDLAIVVDQTVPSQKVTECIYRAGGNHLTSVELFDLYRGTQVRENEKSFAYALTFQSVKRTLTEREVDLDIKRILDLLKSEINASLRD